MSNAPLIPISVCVIAKNEKRNLKDFDTSLRKILGHANDEVVFVDTGSTDGTQERAKLLGYNVIDASHLCTVDLVALAKQWKPQAWAEFKKFPHFTGGVLRSFAEARQISFDAAKNRVCFWLDLDDEILHPEYLRGVLDSLFNDSAPGCLFLRYDYSHDPMDGKVTTTLWRERVVTKGGWKWKGLCHETLIPLNEGIHRTARVVRDSNLPTVISHKHPKPHKFSDLRNYVILRNDFQNDPTKDPRTMFYLGNACRGLEDYDEALAWYSNFVQCSGSRDDIMSARLSMCGCYCAKKQPYRALQEALQAQIVAPEDPRPHYFAANCWAQLEHWTNVVHTVRLGDTMPMPDTLHAVDPVQLAFQPAALASLACRELRQPDEAVMYAQRALQGRPDLQIASKFVHDTTEWANAEKYAQMLMQLLPMAKDASGVIKNMHISPHMARFGLGEPELEIPQPRPGSKHVAIWCGIASEPWGPDSGVKGMGASEKMVVDLAKRVAAQGLSVVVYCTLSCPEGVYDGVYWKQTANFNPELFRDYLIIWRVPAILTAIPFRAGKIYVWLHDCGNPRDWTPQVLALTDKVLFLSKFQRGLHPEIPEDKVCYTRNGIDITRSRAGAHKRKKHIIYMSSPDRGWQMAVAAFHASGLAREGYTLHMYYGFGKTFRAHATTAAYGTVSELGRERRLLEYEAECLAMADGKTVIDHKRVGWQEMADALAEADIWFYPTKFDEISCVSAMEAMAAGCKIVATKHAALAETLEGYPGLREIKEPVLPVSAGNDLRFAALDMTVDRDACAEFGKKFDLDLLAPEWSRELFS